MRSVDRVTDRGHERDSKRDRDGGPDRHPIAEPERDDPEAGADPPTRVWTRAEVAALGPRLGRVDPWQIVRLQARVAVGVVVLAGLLGLWIGGLQASGKVGTAVSMTALIASAGYGSACAVLPSALMAWGLGRARRRDPGGKQDPQPSPGVVAVRFLSWEFVKIGVSVVMLLLAPLLVPATHWPALLAGLVLCTKAFWLAPLLLRRRGRDTKD